MTGIYCARESYLFVCLLVLYRDVGILSGTWRLGPAESLSAPRDVHSTPTKVMNITEGIIKGVTSYVVHYSIGKTHYAHIMGRQLHKHFIGQKAVYCLIEEFSACGSTNI